MKSFLSSLLFLFPLLNSLSVNKQSHAPLGRRGAAEERVRQHEQQQQRARKQQQRRSSKRVARKHQQHWKQRRRSAFFAVASRNGIVLCPRRSRVVLIAADFCEHQLDEHVIFLLLPWNTHQFR